MVISLFHDGGPYHKENSPLICSANIGVTSCSAIVNNELPIRSIKFDEIFIKAKMKLCFKVIKTGNLTI